MACPLCGDDCHCSYAGPSVYGRRSAEVRASSLAFSEPILVDPEGYDSSEQQFAASLAQPATTESRRERNVAQQYKKIVLQRNVSSSREDDAAMTSAHNSATGIERQTMDEQQLQERAALWREEVADRVHSYRTRRSRKRLSGEFSMKLNFEAPSSRAATAAAPVYQEMSEPSAPQAGPESSPAIWFEPEPQPGLDIRQETYAEPEPIEPRFVLEPPPAPKIIEFPRYSYPVMPSMDELAEPVSDKPRILEAPEPIEVTGPPQLANITLEPEQDEEDAVASPDFQFELPLQVAAIPLRVFAAAADWLIVLASTGIFALIAYKMDVVLPRTKPTIALVLALPCFFWALYNYLFMAHATMTPGMRMAGIGLSSFDGGVPRRNTRRGRALAMVLSCASLGLGFFWALIDEDSLCWHDKMTRTYLTVR